MQRTVLITLIAASVLSGVPAITPAAADSGPGWQDGVWHGAGWAWRGGPGWAGRWVWRRGDSGPGWGSFYPGPGYYPFGFPYGYAYPYAARGHYGCYRPIPLDSAGRTFVRQQVC
jgi:hypothetical protein